jgi:hypothetical protein
MLHLLCKYLIQVILRKLNAARGGLKLPGQEKIFTVRQNRHTGSFQFLQTVFPEGKLTGFNNKG